MPYRQIPIGTGEIYHVFNRSVARQPIFISQRDYQRALEVLSFYLYYKPNLRFSHYHRLLPELKTNFLTALKNNHKKQVQISAFCLMPNHYHFLIRGIEDHGISNFVRNFQNSYAKYFNIKTERSGAVFQSMFKAVRIESDQQLIHVCRYIHLNPLTSYVLKDKKDLESYRWSSFVDYIGKRKLDILDVDLILKQFSSVEQFINFRGPRVRGFLLKFTRAAENPNFSIAPTRGRL